MNEKQIDSLQLVVITGMSGAGKTVAVQSFEDMGFSVLTTYLQH